MARSLLNAFENNHVFSEKEAWLLFRVSAIAEACGWTLLISGILWQQATGWHAPVLIAGQLHGTMFFGYMIASVGLYPNLGWPRTKSFFALLASIPPYGSIIFEQWAAHQRRAAELKIYSYSTVFAMLIDQQLPRDL